MLGMDVAAPAVPIGEFRTYLRIETDAEDAVLAGLLRAATSMVEAWLGRQLIARMVAEGFDEPTERVRLAAGPVVEVSEILGPSAEGGEAPLAADAWRLARLRDGSGEICFSRRPAGPVTVRYRAGMAEDWNGLPEALRLAVLRAAGHLHANRDGAGDAGLPGVVCQLLAPWRRLRLA